MIKLLITILALTTIGCSNKAVYENIQSDQRNQCLKEPPPTYEQCLERTQKSYEQYERERKELLDKTH